MNTYAIILASGTGSRFGSELPKQFIKINNKTILEYSIDIFENNNKIDGIYIVITPEYINIAEKIIANAGYKKIKAILCGGQTRKQSSYIGVNAIPQTEANIIIHDCARPLLSQSTLDRCITELKQHNAIVCAIPLSDTVINVKNNFVDSIPDRKTLQRVQTPQCFKLSLIKKAHELSLNDNNFTDDCGLILKHNLAKVFVIDGDITNIKITYPQDLTIAETILNKSIK